MSMKLVILGLLLEGDKHPYEVQHIMKDRQMDYYIKYAKGSLYYAFEQLEKQGAIRITTIVRDTNRPDKTIFHITEEGKQLFHTLLLKQFEAKNQIYKPIYSALSFTHFGDDQELVPILEKKKHDTVQYLHKMQTIYDCSKGKIPRAQLYILQSVIEHITVELQWLSTLLNDAIAGRLSKFDVDEN
ncbi:MULTISPECIES: PadR family transcriptional regulator [Bacillus]|mgnify:CR=1 FL=1|uniref:PadR family transcriptional regulator n=2 Tax=Bacillus toyonensis TaxID=155322 RepID=A0A2B4YSS0_9BACI|nr:MULTISPECIES: PadR family transcriptional regulator [Bacillus]KAB0446264.1 PadR family transcriptional regulator [Lysinibacillus sp. VIA-II-2016]KNH37970.1 PadR family transcriptional regulator [Bacillus thuringiensis]KXY19592.1 PadR family transcriptional regulator [Bacillus cereus]MDH8703192.1 DNA-binding PadR family transcriptional regulator [Stenotrophomonas sp. 1198]OTX35873.1 PadR family transcriptional regulator [Bacillus thuringiensis serovar malayensis]OUB10330.1 PadR family trans